VIPGKKYQKELEMPIPRGYERSANNLKTIAGGHFK
jgi:hypothetical protein